MPANIHLFDMLQPGVLQGMATTDLIGELERVRQMESRVTEYLAAIIEILRRRLYV
jgi:hypothetical protein